jgi:hypothetical protein
VKGLEPGGLAVDVVRSCYSTKARLFRDDPTETDITWYFVPEDRPFLPFPTAISSRNWDATTTIWPAGKENPPSGNGTEVGEVIGAPRPWRNGSDPVHYPGLHPVGTPEEFARGLKQPPLEYEDVCRSVSGLIYTPGWLRWLTTWGDSGDSGGPLTGFMPCEGLEAVARCFFQGRDVHGTFRLRLATVATGVVGPFTVYGDIIQPTDPAYDAIALPAGSLAVSEYTDAGDCYWFGSHDIVYFHFTAEAFIRDAFVTCELTPGTERLLWYMSLATVLHVPNTGGDLGITLLGLSFYGHVVGA